MNGKKLFVEIVFGILFFGICTFPGYAMEGAGRIAVLVSDDETAYAQSEASFLNEIDKPVERFNLHGDMELGGRLMTEIMTGKPPALVFALGAKAATIAALWTRERLEIPVVFAMVLNWRRYRILNKQRNVSGIASEMAPGTQFINMTMISPAVDKIGVIYSDEQSHQIIAQAKKAAALLGLELITYPIRNSKEFKHSFKKISSKINGFWIVNDPVVYSLANIDWLEQRCIIEQLVCLGQSKNIAKLGVVLAVSPDIANIGSQAASMAKNILDRGQTPQKIGVMAPLGAHLLLNKKTSQRIGLQISSAAMDMVNEVVE